MLERTATSLEPCSLQRVLPTTRHSVKSRRELHTAFWQHGATEYELFDACQALARSSFLELTSLPIRRRMESRPETLTASTTLLSFVYPNGVSGFLRRFLSTGPERREWPTSKLNPVRLRMLYSSRSGSDEAILADSSTASVEVQAVESAPNSADVKTTTRDFWHADPEELRKLLKSTRGLDFAKLWSLYSRLEDGRKENFKADVMMYLARSDRPVEATRVYELFSSFRAAEWTEDLVATAIKAMLMLDKLKAAANIAHDAFDRHRITQGIDRLVAHAIQSTSAERFLRVWESIASKLMKLGKFRPPKLEEVCAIPSLGKGIDRLYAFIQEAGSAEKAATVAGWKKSLDYLAEQILKQGLTSLQPDDARLILRHMEDSRIWEKFMRTCMDNGHKSTVKTTYREYRKLPKLVLNRRILRKMVDVFYPDDVAGMKELRQDWKTRECRMDQRSYQKFIAFYARRGDVRSATEVWKEYLQTNYNHSHPDQDESTLTSLMNAYAKRGELKFAQETLEKIIARRNREFNKIEGNILLNAYRGAGDYEGAVGIFSTMYESGRVDHRTFSNMMAFAGFRGDLMFTLDLYNMARDEGLEPDIAMLDALVEAYCQNDRYAEAERICLQATTRKLCEGDYVVLWNTLLAHHARRRDLETVNRLLELLSSHGISYNNDTYSQLLTALANCRQSHHALHLLKTAQKDGIFEPTTEHWLLVLSAFLKNREPHMALAVDNMIKNKYNNYKNSASRITKVIEALGRWQEMPADLRQGRDGYFFLNKAFQAFTQSMGRVDGEILDDSRTAVAQYSRIIFILTQMREFATIPQVLSLYHTHFPPKHGYDPMPMRLLSNILLVEFYEGKYDRLQETWKAILDKAYHAAKAHPTEQTRADVPGEKSKVSTALRYVLCDPLKTMQRYFLLQGDAYGLIGLISSVLDRGFLLDNKNWNCHVQALAKLKKWKEAFKVCEEKLMPRWTGWSRQSGKLPLQPRRIGSSPFFLRPISHTILILAKEYMDLERMAPWSHEAAKVFYKIRNEHPKVVHAINTLQPTGSELEREIFGDDAGRFGGRRRDSRSWNKNETEPRDSDSDADEDMNWLLGRSNASPNGSDERDPDGPALYDNIWKTGPITEAGQAEQQKVDW